MGFTAAYPSGNTWYCGPAIVNWSGHGPVPPITYASDPAFWVTGVTDYTAAYLVGDITYCTQRLANTHKQDADYPDWCPHCGAAAYIGLRKVDCKAQCKTASSPYL